MNATHNTPSGKPEDVEHKTAWCRICHAFRKFFKCGRFFWCSECHYQEGTNAELVVMNE